MTVLTWNVETVRTKVYVGFDNRPIQGYEVSFNIPELGEVLRVDVPNIDEGTVKNAIDKIVNQRQSLTEI